MMWVAHSKRELKPMLERLAVHLSAKGVYPVEVKPKKYVPHRTLSQNSFFHAVVGQMADELRKRTGLDYTPEWLKTKLKRDFGLVRHMPDPVTGEQTPYLVSTADYDAGEMVEFLDKVLAYANEELAIEILPAGEYAGLKHGRS